MKEMKESEIKYYRNNFFLSWRGKLLGRFFFFVVAAVGAFWVCFFFVFVLGFFLHHIPKTEKMNKKRREGRPSG